MNRLALHESAVAGLSPTALIGIARLAGFDSVGLRVAHSDSADRWWRKGAGADELRGMVDGLLAGRISVLDVGRAELDPQGDESVRTVLDLASRLGARHITAVAAGQAGPTDVARLYAELIAAAEAYQLVPLLAPHPGTAVDSFDGAIDIARRVGGAVVLDFSLTMSAEQIEDLVLRAGLRLGYLRVHSEELDTADEADIAGRMATVPVHVPVAVGSAAIESGGEGSSGALGIPDLVSRVARWRQLVDRMLEHPRARAAREAGEQPAF